MYKKYDINNSSSSQYRPEGMVQQSSQFGKLKQFMSCLSKNRPAEVVLAINCLSHRSLTCTPFKYLFDNNLDRLPINNVMQLKNVCEPTYQEAVKDYTKTYELEDKQQDKE